MKKIAFFVLVLAAIVIANEEEIPMNKADEEALKACLSEVGMTMEELETAEQKFRETKDDEKIDEETINAKHIGHAMACFLEKTNMMKDSKLILDKLVEALSIINKEDLTKYINSLNENDALTREERAFEIDVYVNRMLPKHHEK